MTTASPPPAGAAHPTTPQAEGGLKRALWALRGYDTTALATIGPEGPHVAGVYFAPEPAGGGLRLILAVLRDSRKRFDLAADPRVAFMCSPGNPSRWIQGSGHATIVLDEEQHHDLYTRLIEHAAGARLYVEDGAAVFPVIVTVSWLKVVEEAGTPPLVLDLAGSV